MKTVLVDSNVLLDIATNDSAWFGWSCRAPLAYRRRGGPRSAPLPDLHIGAHVAVAYFPTVELIAP
jgi:hypothetical protein